MAEETADILEPTSFLFPNEQASNQLVEEAIRYFSAVKVPSSSPIQKVVTKNLDAWQVYNQLAIAAKHTLDDLPDLDVEEDRPSDEESYASEDSQEENQFEALPAENPAEDVENEEEEFLGFSDRGDEENDHLSDENIENEDLETGNSNEEDENEQVQEDQEPKKDVFGLNDKFFDIDEFNKQTLALEEQEDEQNHEIGEEEEDDIDLFVDPEEEDEEEEGGPRADSILYEDFFGPKSAKGRREVSKKKKRDADASKKKKAKRVPKPEESDEEEDQEEPQNDDNTFERVRKDLFADEEEEENENSQQLLSSYERDKARISQQIKELESENVAKKPWTLIGEATSKSRPSNSLLDVDIDFETGAKPVPVQTEETTSALEDVIKNRILEKRFDDVPRKAPSSLPEFRPSELFELDENKPQQSLADIYEEQYMKKANPDTYQSGVDKKRQDDYNEIKTLFEDVSYTLDALSSWHYIPAPAEANVQVVSNAPTLAMEEAQPTASSDAMALAPQEVYQPSMDNRQNETVERSGIAVSKAEMDHSEKQARRRRVRTKHAEKRKQLGEKRRGTEKEQVVRQLSRADVQVIGAGGERKRISSKSKDKPAAALSSNQLLL
ncbi:U3 snoRNP-associated protein Mpp1 [Schizosaccharomyces cryophilus OY26]|uniref:U3 small nucleolar ribonucleoprotein protein MPP10 n=1 Tax=Schizosaccharomyces cryophilus (strain OY26 / ATCC MYA-4695 / CBS 11777 / NBRC 106824 / NRRL Y48691) TaxID=653667 RepID=S9VVD8_SCHCR|nr:U3 snoRNP-associated protein Mpp1 [Schizosaccharomyces cryophilus OY26]EPY51748.1 U3 snoRNP-associated protein Mpp1 [Schizosaccharomyces cryophilus OY26]